MYVDMIHYGDILYYDDMYVWYDMFHYDVTCYNMYDNDEFFDAQLVMLWMMNV